MTQQLPSNTFTTAKWIVSPTASDGSHTTIQSAINSASSGDTIFIRPGTYTENLTLKAGVNLTAYINDQELPNVTIVGNCTFTSTGICGISSIRLQTNGANPLLTVSGANASSITLDNCYVNASTNTGIVFSSSNANSLIRLNNCSCKVSTNGTALYTHTSAGNISLNYCVMDGVASTTANDNSAGGVSINFSTIFSQFSTSGTGVIFCEHSNFNSTNTLTFNITGTGNSSDFTFVTFESGNSANMSIGAGASAEVKHCSSGSDVGGGNAFTGAGTMFYAFICFTGTATSQNVGTATALTVI